MKSRIKGYYNENYGRGMANSIIEFFECENSACKLRFPMYDGQLKLKRCPLCRSSLISVATVDSQFEGDLKPQVEIGWQVEAILDNIRSAWNVGSIFRTADGTGIRKLYLCGITPTPQNTKVSKTALGAEVNVSWEHENNSLLLASRMQTNGYQLWALEDTREAVPLFESEYEPEGKPVVLIAGNEVCGVDPGLLAISDRVLSIPMFGNKQSYNVAVAFGMAVSFLVYRHRVGQGSRNIFPST
jgi:tRNA G18 (ribose-2'-O)-methylase SpoU